MSDEKNPLRVGLLVTCLVDMMRPRIGFAALELLEAAGCTVIVPETQTCCGQPAYNAGDKPTARALALKLLGEFEACDYLVIPSGSCTAMIRRHYVELVDSTSTNADPALAQRLAALAARTHELTDFLANIVKPDTLPRNFQGSLTYHDSCSGLRELGIKAQPRALLGQLPGLRLQEMQNAEECCGFGGAFAVKFGEISSAIAERKCDGIRATTCDAVAGGDLGCLLNIEGKLRRMGDETTRVLHIAEILAGMMDSD